MFATDGNSSRKERLVKILHALVGVGLYWLGRLTAGVSHERPDMGHQFLRGMRDGFYVRDFQPWLGDALYGLQRRGLYEVPERIRIPFVSLHQFSSGQGKAP